MTRLQRLVLGHGVAATAMAMPWPVLLVLTWDQTHSDTWLAVVGAARMAPYVALSWAAGSLADRISRTTVIRLSAQARAVLLVGAAIAVHAGHVGAAVALATLTVVAGTPAYPSLAAAMPSTAGRLTDSATSWLVTLEVSAFVVGPAVGGLLLGLAGPDATMTGAALMGCIGVPLLTALRLRPDRAAPSRSRSTATPPAPDVARTRGQVRLVIRSPGAVRVIAAVAAVNFVLGAVGVALLPMADRGWTNVDAFGPLTAAMGLGALAAPAVRRLLRLSPTAVRIALLLVALPLLMVAVTPTWVWALPPLALVGAAATQVECVATSLLQRFVPDVARATALGLADTVMVTGALVGAGLAPWLSVVVGPRLLFVSLAVFTVLVLRSVPRDAHTDERQPARDASSRGVRIRHAQSSRLKVEPPATVHPLLTDAAQFGHLGSLASSGKRTSLQPPERDA